MSIEPTRFTYKAATLSDAVDLIGANAFDYCTKMQPIECGKFPRGNKDSLKNPSYEKECREFFFRCVADAKYFEAWHRMN